MRDIFILSDLAKWIIKKVAALEAEDVIHGTALAYNSLGLFLHTMNNSNNNSTNKKEKQSR